MQYMTTEGEPSYPPQDDPSAKFAPARQALLGMMQQGSQGSQPNQAPQQATTGEERAALSYLDAAQELLQAAGDNLPGLMPFIAQASAIIAQGLQVAVGSMRQISGPPNSQTYPNQAPPPLPQGQGQGTAPGSVAGSGPENIYLPL